MQVDQVERVGSFSADSRGYVAGTGLASVTVDTAGVSNIGSSANSGDSAVGPTLFPLLKAEIG